MLAVNLDELSRGIGDEMFVAWSDALHPHDPEAAPGVMEGQQFLLLRNDELYVKFLFIGFMLFSDGSQMMG